VCAVEEIGLDTGRAREEDDEDFRAGREASSVETSTAASAVASFGEVFSFFLDLMVVKLPWAIYFLNNGYKGDGIKTIRCKIF
jgi:hypothetical protein